MKTLISLSAACILVTAPALAVQVKWTDWTAGSSDEKTVYGTIVTDTSTIAVTYSNPQTYAFLQTGSGTDYWENWRGAVNSPYTSAVVDNIPTASEMIALDRAGMQTLTFSETVANPFFSYISLNGNGYAFDRDFEILSYGGLDGNYSGYWGPGSSYKNVVALGGGNFEYQLLGSGEPHGTIRFLGTFDSVSWRSLSDEYWNGFTVGVEGTAAEVYPVPESGATIALLALALPGFLASIRRIRS